MAQIALGDYLAEIDQYIEEQRLNEASAHCRHILREYPRHVETYRLLGKALLEQQNYIDAADVFQRILSADPEDFVSHVGMSIIYKDGGLISQAVWHMERAFELDPYNVVIREELGDLYADRDEQGEAKVELNQGALARLYVKGELYERAVEEIRDILQADENRIDMEILLAEALWRADKRVDAVDVCVNILENLPNCSKANAILSEVWLLTGRLDEAHEHLDRLQALHLLQQDKLDPNSIVARAFSTVGAPHLPNEILIEQHDFSLEPIAVDSDIDEELPDWVEELNLTALPSTSQDDEPDDAVTTSDMTTKPLAGRRRDGTNTSPLASDAADDDVPLPDWMRDLEDPSGAKARAEAGEQIEWLSSVGEEPDENEFAVTESTVEVGEEDDAPDWLTDILDDDEFGAVPFDVGEGPSDLAPAEDPLLDESSLPALSSTEVAEMDAFLAAAEGEADAHEKYPAIDDALILSPQLLNDEQAEQLSWESFEAGLAEDESGVESSMPALETEDDDSYVEAPGTGEAAALHIFPESSEDDLENIGSATATDDVLEPNTSTEEQQMPMSIEPELFPDDDKTPDDDGAKPAGGQSANDDALDWLNQLAASDSPAGDDDANDMPDWLLQDLDESPKADWLTDEATTPAADDSAVDSDADAALDALLADMAGDDDGGDSWLAGIVSGDEEAIEEPPTMSWSSNQVADELPTADVIAASDSDEGSDAMAWLEEMSLDDDDALAGPVDSQSEIPATGFADFGLDDTFIQTPSDNFGEQLDFTNPSDSSLSEEDEAMSWLDDLASDAEAPIIEPPSVDPKTEVMPDEVVAAENELDAGDASDDAMAWLDELTDTSDPALQSSVADVEAVDHSTAVMSNAELGADDDPMDWLDELVPSESVETVDDLAEQGDDLLALVNDEDADLGIGMLSDAATEEDGNALDWLDDLASVADGPASELGEEWSSQSESSIVDIQDNLQSIVGPHTEPELAIPDSELREMEETLNELAEDEGTPESLEWLDAMNALEDPVDSGDSGHIALDLEPVDDMPTEPSLAMVPTVSDDELDALMADDAIADDSAEVDETTISEPVAFETPQIIVGGQVVEDLNMEPTDDPVDGDDALAWLQELMNESQAEMQAPDTLELEEEAVAEPVAEVEVEEPAGSEPMMLSEADNAFDTTDSVEEETPPTIETPQIIVGGQVVEDLNMEPTDDPVSDDDALSWLQDLIDESQPEVAVLEQSDLQTELDTDPPDLSLIDDSSPTDVTLIGLPPLKLDNVEAAESEVDDGASDAQEAPAEVEMFESPQIIIDGQVVEDLNIEPTEDPVSDDDALDWLQELIDESQVAEIGVGEAAGEGEDEAAVVAEFSTDDPVAFAEPGDPEAVDFDTQVSSATETESLSSAIPEDPDEAIKWFESMSGETEAEVDEAADLAWLNDLAAAAGPDASTQPESMTLDEFAASSGNASWLATSDEDEEESAAIAEPAVVDTVESDETVENEEEDVDDSAPVSGLALSEEAVADALPSWLSDEASEGGIDWLDSITDSGVTEWLTAEEEASIQSQISPADVEPEHIEPGTSPLRATDTGPLPPPDTGPLPSLPDKPAPDAAPLEALAEMDSSLLETARASLNGGDVDGSIEAYSALLDQGEGLDIVIADLEQSSVNEQQPMMVRLLGDAYMRVGKLQEALDSYRNALDLM